MATLIIVMSVMNGFRAELIGRILGLNGHVGVYAAEGRGIADFDKLSLKIAEIPGVIAVTPQIEEQAMVTRGTVNIGSVVRGVRWSGPCRAPAALGISRRCRHGRLPGRGRHPDRKSMAFKTGARVGDTIALTTARGEATAFGTLRNAALPCRRRL